MFLSHKQPSNLDLAFAFEAAKSQQSCALNHTFGDFGAALNFFRDVFLISLRRYFLFFAQKPFIKRVTQPASFCPIFYLKFWSVQ